MHVLDSTTDIYVYSTYSATDGHAGGAGGPAAALSVMSVPRLVLSMRSDLCCLGIQKNYTNIPRDRAYILSSRLFQSDQMKIAS